MKGNSTQPRFVFKKEIYWHSSLGSIGFKSILMQDFPVAQPCWPGYISSHIPSHSPEERRDWASGNPAGPGVYSLSRTYVSSQALCMSQLLPGCLAVTSKAHTAVALNSNDSFCPHSCYMAAIGWLWLIPMASSCWDLDWEKHPLEQGRAVVSTREKTVPGVSHEKARRASTPSCLTVCLLMLHSPKQVTQQWVQMYDPFIGSQSE